MEKLRNSGSKAVRAIGVPFCLKQGDPTIRVFACKGCQGGSRKVASDKCVAETYLSRKKAEIKISKPGRNVVSEKETYFSAKEITD